MTVPPVTIKNLIKKNVFHFGIKFGMSTLRNARKKFTVCKNHHLFNVQTTLSDSKSINSVNICDDFFSVNNDKIMIL